MPALSLLPPAWPPEGPVCIPLSALGYSGLGLWPVPRVCLPTYLGSQPVHFLRQALSLQEKLVLLVKQLHQLLRRSLAVLIQLLQSAEERFEMGSEIWLLWRA